MVFTRVSPFLLFPNSLIHTHRTTAKFSEDSEIPIPGFSPDPECTVGASHSAHVKIGLIFLHIIFLVTLAQTLDVLASFPWFSDFMEAVRLSNALLIDRGCQG